MKKARVLVTLNCNRNCEKCCNKEKVFNQHKILTDLKNLKDYDEIMITGGEPMLYPAQTLKIIQQLRKITRIHTRIYLYSAYYNKAKHKPFIPDLIHNINGLHYTLHDNATDADIIALKNLTEMLAYRIHSDFESARLAIDKRLYDKYDFSNINLSAWDVIRKLQWLDNCPLPEGEELFVYQPNGV